MAYEQLLEPPLTGGNQPIGVGLADQGETAGESVGSKAPMTRARACYVAASAASGSFAVD